MTRLMLIGVCLFMGLATARGDDLAEPVPGTESLTWEGDLADRMMVGLHKFVEAKIATAIQKRDFQWDRDTSSREAYEKSIAPNRQRLRKVIGLVDQRVPVHLERIAEDDQSAMVLERPNGRVFRVRWTVLDGVTAEGLLIEPIQSPIAHVIVLPDAGQTPEELALGQRFVWDLVAARVQVMIPVLIDRTDRWSGNDKVALTNQPHREWIWRQAYHMGRHIIGFEVQKVLAATDWIESRFGESAKIGVAGYGEGGLLALYSAAIDTRLQSCLVSGYFESRSRPWEEPIYRHVWSLTREFGDAELGAMVAPRSLIVEYSTSPRVDGPPPPVGGRRGGAAVGKITTPSWDSVHAEFQRINQLVPGGFQERTLLSNNAKPGQPLEPFSAATSPQMLKSLSVSGSLKTGVIAPGRPVEVKLDPALRQQRQVLELERFVQRLVRESDATREKHFPIGTLSQPRSAEGFAESTKKFRDYFRDEIMGRFDDRLLPANPRTRQIYDREKWTGYDVVLDVYPEVFAWGVLLLPKDLKPDEKRPVVICQHGRNGIPKMLIEGNEKAYNDYAAKLADLGYIVFVPHNPYRGEDKYRLLSRKANSVKASLFSFILAQHEQILKWLSSLPEVDSKRIAFYGLSYGGETAVRIPPLLDGYCLSICSADFNDWARKVASTDAKYSFMFTVEWEMPYFDMGSTYNYGEMVALLAPRPFMVERGHGDGVAPDEWVAYEYAKVRRLYDALRIGDRTELEVFDGVHEINGQGTFRFLETHLNWPPK
jgi:cephalosporin-C deacetylase-like acetyl esterase